MRDYNFLLSIKYLPSSMLIENYTKNKIEIVKNKRNMHIYDSINR